MRPFPTWRSAIPEWLAHLAETRAASTVKARRIQINLAANALPPLRKVTTLDVASYLARYDHPVTIASHLAALRSFFAWCLDQRIIKRNPATTLKAPPKPVYRARPVPDSTLARALRFANPTATRVLVMGGILGMRRQEIARSHRDHYDPATQLLTVLGKGRRLRRVPVPDEYAALFEQPSGWYFPSPRNPGKHVTPNTIGHHASAALRGGYTTHTLRHRAGTAIQNLSHDLRLTQEFLGHASTATTVIYTRVTDDQLRDVITAAAMPLQQEA
jgi:site-specific recombinase XerD